jgi:hypothetical protein
MRIRIFDRVKDFLRGNSRRRMTYQDLNKHWEQDYTVSWNDKFNEAVIHQCKEVPAEYKEHWRREAEYSICKFRELQEELRKKREREAHRND